MARSTGGILFGPYRLDVAEARLWQGDEPVPLQPRPLAVLSYLAARPGSVVPRDELIARLWSGTHVTKAVLKVAVRAIREALHDDADAPRYIETVGRDGYRFVGAGAGAPPAAPLGATGERAGVMVGRAADLARLHAALAQARAGTRRLVFVTGEAGVGKTTLVERFVDEVQRAGDAAVARGQCLEQYGEGEAYLPILEAFGRLLRGAEADALREPLTRHAPTWGPQLAALDLARTAESRREGAIATMPARMLREMADALEVFTQDRVLLLVLEDLQWSDPSTVDLLGCLARRGQSARLLIVASLRPADLTAGDHPLRGVQHELQAKGLCEEIALGLLSGDDVDSYLHARCAGAEPAVLRRVAARVHQRSEGNALFMINIVTDLIADGLLVCRNGGWQVEGSIETATERIPAALQELIGRDMRELPAAVRQALEAASVAGDEFAVTAVAAALGGEADEVEEICEQLAAQGALLVEAGVADWPDGSVSGRYRFRHALYRRVLYEGIAPARRIRLHRAIGLRVEAGYGARAGEHAAELAMHFTRGHAHDRALRFHELAAAAALDRHAAHEAMAHCTAALAALAHVPDEPERARREFELVVARATLLMAIKGYAAAETEEAFARAHALCGAAPVGAPLYALLRGLLSYHQVRAALGEAHRFGEELLRHAAEQPGDAVLRVQAHYGQGTTLFHLGGLDAARQHLDAALRDYDPATHRQHVFVYGGYDPGVACSLWSAFTLILQGEIDEAVARCEAALALAQRHGDLFSLAWAFQGIGVSRQLLGDWAACARASAEAIRIADEQGFPHVLGMATVNRGWALIMQGDADAGIPLLRQGLALVERTGASLLRPSYLGMLAVTHVLEGDRGSAVALFDEAFAELERSGERVLEAPLLIGKSHLLATGGERGRSSRVVAGAAEDCLRQALDVARAQGARLVELRAAVALARHCRARGRADEAVAPLSAAYAWFADRPPAAAEVAAAQDLLNVLQAS